MESDIKGLRNLKRFYSSNDKFRDSKNCLIAELFKTAKLEYVYVYNKDINANILTSITLTVNIRNLRFFCVYLAGKDFSVTLDV